MADKYSKINKINPLTLTIMGLFVVASVLLIVFLQPSPKLKLLTELNGVASQYQVTLKIDEDHPFVRVDSKKLDKIVAKGDLTLVLVGDISNTILLNHLGSISKYLESHDIKNNVSTVYILEYTPNQEYLDSFFKENKKTIKSDLPQIIAYKDGKYLSQVVLVSETDEKGYNRAVKKFFDLVYEKLTVTIYD